MSPRTVLICAAAVGVVGLSYGIYSAFRIDVPARHVAVLIRKTGEDVSNRDEAAPTEDHKGIQPDLLTEGRYFRNPYYWDWEVVPQVEVPSGKLGVVIRLHGDDPPIGSFLAEAGTKGIVPQVLRPGRYALHPYLERVEMHDPVTVPAGFKGVVTHLAGALPGDPNQLLVDSGSRGVQRDTLDPGTYYVNPYVKRVDLVDCRSQRLDLATGKMLGFPSKDGFWVSLDGIIEFRVKPERAAEVFVTYNEVENGPRIDRELIRKVVLPNARSFCRLEGSKSLGRELIQGATRTQFQDTFQSAMRSACESLGIEIIQALITEIRPPEAIASPVRDREIAKQKLAQFRQQINQQESEKLLSIERTLIDQKKQLVQAEQEVVQLTTEAFREQEVAVTKAQERLGVSRHHLDAARDEAAALVARARADAEVIQFGNEAEAAGWRKSVEAFGGDGEMFARYVLLKKFAPAFERIMANTADSPLMQMFDQFSRPELTPVPATTAQSRPSPVTERSGS